MIAKRFVQRIMGPAGFAGLAFCLLFPFTWNKIFPQLEDSEIHAPLSQSPPAVVASAKVVRSEPTLLEEGTRESVFRASEWRNYRLTLEKGGRYSIFGASFPLSSPSLDLRFNGNTVSTLAFYRTPEERNGRLVPHRIATGVNLREGANRLHLEGLHLFDRSLLLVLRPENDLTLTRFAYLFLAGAGFYTLLILGTPTKTKETTRLRITLATSALFIVGIPAATAVYRGSELCNLGDLNPELSQDLRDFETYLRSPEHRANRGAKKGVVIFGDSSHIMRLEPEEQMLPALRRGVLDRGGQDIEIFGIASGGFSAFDYYFLLNRIVTEKPDLVIVPVNQRWFADIRMYGKVMDILDFHILEAYVRPSELPRVLPVEVGNRDFSLGLILYQKLNLKVFNRKLEYFRSGAAVWTHHTSRYLEERACRMFPKTYSPISEWIRDEPDQAGSYWNDSIAEDHEFFQMFRLINGLAKRRGISILYYSTNQNVQAQLENGQDLRLPQNTAVIKRAITREPHTYFLDLAASNPPEMFSDANEHLTPDGITKIAGQLSQATLLILGETKGDLEIVPYLEQGPL